MTGVGGENATGFLDPVKRQRVGAEPVDPELLFEQSPERLGLGVNVLRSVPFSKGAGELAGGAAGGIDIALHLAQRDRALRQRPVRMEDGIVAVLPRSEERRVGKEGVSTCRTR